MYSCFNFEKTKKFEKSRCQSKTHKILLFSAVLSFSSVVKDLKCQHVVSNDNHNLELIGFVNFMG